MPAERESVSALLSPTVLVAEDSGDTRHMLKRALEIRGYRVLEAENGRQALELTRQYKPHLIIVDLNMPVLDGLETIKYVRMMKGARNRFLSLPSPHSTFTAWKKPPAKRDAMNTSASLSISTISKR